MANFLDLARELRDHIYTAVLEAEIPPPSAPSESGPRRTQGLMRSPQSVYVNSNVLLLINHQVHDETTEIIQNLIRTGRLRYKLDCILMDGTRIYPTWLAIPAVSSTVASVEVNFRPTLDCHDLSLEYIPSVDIGLAYILSKFLYRFLETSPDNKTGAGGLGRMQIDELVLSVTTSPPITPKRVLRSTTTRNLDEIAPYCLLYSEAVSRTVAAGIGGLLRIRSPITNPSLFGPPERVRLVKIFLDGKLKKVWNVRETEGMNFERRP